MRISFDIIPAMGRDVAFFSTPDDKSAATAESRPGGPLGWPVVVGERKTGWFRKEPIFEESGPAFDGFAARWYDPVTMGTLEALLTGRSYDDIASDPAWATGVTPDNDEDHGVLTLRTNLRDAMAEATAEQLTAVVKPWSETEEFTLGTDGEVTQEDRDAHLEFLRELRDLARRAKANDHRLYWYFEL